MKKTILLLAVTLSVLTANNNIGFLANQKYICASKGMLVDGKMNPTSQEDALKYPIRFYVDDNNVMHTDSKLKLAHLKKTEYSDGDNSINLKIFENKRYIMTTNNKLISFGAVVIYVCAETNNWTITK